MAKPDDINEEDVEQLDDDPATEAKRKGYYFDNHKVEQLLTVYVKGCCTDVDLRDEIMSHAAELIRQIIRTHNFHNVYPGRDPASFGDLFQVAWCVSPDTIIMTDRGIGRIDDFIPNSSIGAHDIEVYGIGGPNKSNNYIRLPEQDTFKIITKFGYNIEVTGDHKLYVMGADGPEWKEAQKLTCGDEIAIQYGQDYFGNNNKIDFVPKTCGGTTIEWRPPIEFTDELAYIIGLIIAEGSIEKHRIVIYNKSDDVIGRLINNNLGLNFRYESEGRIVINSIRFVEFIKWMDVGVKSHNKKIPSKILLCSRNILTNMLRGMFDGDGHSNKNTGHVGYTSTSRTLIDQLRCLLLNFGIVTKTSTSNRGYTNTPDKHGGYKRSKVKVAHQLLMSTIDSATFYETIGFNISYKQLKASKLSDKPFKYMCKPTVQKLRSLVYGYGFKNYSIKKKHNIDLRLHLNNKYITESTAKSILNIFQQFEHLDEYKFIADRVSENISWQAIKSISASKSSVVDIEVPHSRSFTSNGFISHNCQIESTLYKFDWSPGHTKVFNMWSQVSKTVILAHIKKEMRDKKNSDSYKRHLGNKRPRKGIKMERFLAEAREVFKYNEEHLALLKSLEELYSVDNRPYEGLIGKLVDLSGLPRQKVSEFLKDLRLKGIMFSDAPIHEEKIHRDNRAANQKRGDFEEDEYD